LLKPISDAIAETEGNTVPISVAVEVMKYIRNEIENVLVNSNDCFSSDDIYCIRRTVDNREEFAITFRCESLGSRILWTKLD